MQLKNNYSYVTQSCRLGSAGRLCVEVPRKTAVPRSGGPSHLKTQCWVSGVLDCWLLHPHLAPGVGWLQQMRVGFLFMCPFLLAHLGSLTSVTGQSHFVCGHWLTAVVGRSLQALCDLAQRSFTVTLSTSTSFAGPARIPCGRTTQWRMAACGSLGAIFKDQPPNSFLI